MKRQLGSWSACLAITAILLSLVSCGGGGGGGGGGDAGSSAGSGSSGSSVIGGVAPQSEPARLIVSGTVQAPGGSLAFYPRPGLMERLAGLFVGSAGAALTGVSRVPDLTIVQLARIDETGASTAVLATTRIASGTFSFDLTSMGLSFDSTLVVLVRNPDTGACMRAFVTSSTVDIDPVSEAVVQLVLQKVAATHGTLSQFTPQELSDLRGSVDVLTTCDQTPANNTLEATVADVMTKISSNGRLSAFLDAAAGTGQTSEGPGDMGNYFPMTGGNKWEASVTSQQAGSAPTIQTSILEITGAKIIGGVQALVFRTSDLSGSSSSEDYRVENGTGIIYYGNNDPSDTITPQIGPYFEARFPLQKGSSFEQFNKSGLDCGSDLDGDGINEALALRSVATVLDFEPVTVDAGTFQNCAKIQTVLTEILTSSRYGTRVSAIGTLTEWYAPGVGPVKKQYLVSSAGPSSTSAYSLIAYNADGRSNLSAPRVTSAQPVDLVALASQVLATFSDGIDPGTINTSTFTVKDSAGNLVAGSVSYSSTSRMAVFEPMSPLPCGTYAVTISTGVKNLLGVPLGGNYTWTFTLDNQGPIVVSRTPADNATAVPLSAVMTATFSEDMNTGALQGWFNLQDAQGGETRGHVVYAGRTATYTPFYLNANTTYAATITSMAYDTAGNRVGGNASWSFTTGDGLFLPPAQFISVSGYANMGAVGDINGDGKVDMVVVNDYDGGQGGFSHRLLIYWGDGSGGFSAPTAYDVSRNVLSVAIGDVNHDGRNDMVLGMSSYILDETGNFVVGTNYYIGVVPQNTSGGFDPIVGYAVNDGQTIRLADLNHDGLLDVAGTTWGSGTVSVLLQNAAGTLNDAVAYSVINAGASGLQAGDVNNDGLTDIVVARGDATPGFAVLLQKADGTLNTPIYYSIADKGVPNGVVLGDINNDGLTDVIVSHWAPANGAPGLAVFSQKRAGGFADPVFCDFMDNGAVLGLADVNGDGRTDVIELNYSGIYLGVFLQSADGSLLAEERYPAVQAGLYSAAVVDTDGDGLHDIVFAATNGGLWAALHTPASKLNSAVLKRALTSSGSETETGTIPTFTGIRIRSF